jgi:hypothetical protein
MLNGAFSRLPYKDIAHFFAVVLTVLWRVLGQFFL